MTTYQRPPRPTLDMQRLTTDLASLDDDDFRLVVDADLRRSATSHSTRSELPADIAAALRSAKYVERWLSMLLRMSKSVEGQLNTRADDYEAKRSGLRGRLIRAQDRLAGATTPQDRREAEHEIALVQADIEDLRASYLESRSRTLRFKSGLDEALLEARQVRDTLRDSTHDSIAEDRDFFAQRSADLESAIRRHRQRMEDDDMEPTAMDEALWKILGTTTHT